MSENLTLIASYPKAGSTWIRLMFEALSRPLDGRVALNELSDGFYGVWRRLLFDDFAPVNSADLLPEEIDELLPEVYRQLASELSGPVLVKTHDLAFRTRTGQWMFPPDCVRHVIYLVRHPFDVAVSLAHHVSLSVERTVHLMSHDHVMAPAAARLVLPLHERVGSWSSNIASWLDEAPYPLTLVRYEDLHSNPMEAFGRVAEAAGFRTTPNSIRHAVDAIKFERLQGEEQTHGFIERPRNSPRFFRAGKPLSWEGELDAALRELVVEDHGAMMERLGYTPDGGARPLPAQTADNGHRANNDSCAG